MVTIVKMDHIITSTPTHVGTLRSSRRRPEMQKTQLFKKSDSVFCAVGEGGYYGFIKSTGLRQTCP